MERSEIKSHDIELTLPAGEKLILRPVTPEDEEFLIAVYGKTREDELAQAEWGEGQKDQFVRWQFGLQQREYQSRFPDYDYRVIVINDRAAGRIWVGRDDEQIRLLEIAIMPEFQNRGAGTILLRRLIEQANQTNKVLRHMVFVLNNDAHRFYERLGFEVIEDFGAYKHMEWRPDKRSAD